MPDIQSPRGTRDILPIDQPLWQSVKETSIFIAEQMGFQAITVPTFENVALFQRSIGNGTDIMDKELFLVRSPHTESGKEEYALRPEGTAGIVRAYIEHGMSALPQPVKLYSIVNNFRYDRPQKGRYREHVQISLEYFGDATPFSDAWVILCSYRALKEMGVKNLLLHVNTLGSSEERVAYAATLQSALRPHLEELSEDSKRRLEINPLRILDSKDARDQALLETVPGILDSLGEESIARYEKVLEYLSQWDIPFEQDNRLVRGLDYYSHTTFEWVVAGKESQQGSLGGGGRYDGLVAILGGQQTPAVGAGIGLDRVVVALEEQGDEPLSYPGVDFFIAADTAGKSRAAELIALLLEEGWSVDAVLGKDSLSSQLKVAHRSNANALLILGEAEFAEGTIQLKTLDTGEQVNIPLATITEELNSRFQAECDCENCTQ